MLFNSFEFAIFFPIVTILFFLIPHKLRWMLLLAASCVFYMYFKPQYILILALIIVIDYFAAIKIDEQATEKLKKRWLTLSIAANLGILFYFKYFNFFIENINWAINQFQLGREFNTLDIILPIGLSFHTFQAMSYTIEVKKGKVKPEKHFGIYALYVMFYPQLVAGPIERPQNLLPQFHQRQYFKYENARRGLILIAWGLFKKVVIADRLAFFVNQVHSMQTGFYTGIPLIISMLFFTYQIYCDFSGYNDIATGCALVMGFKLMDNFKTPFIQPNLSKFWATYHISLTSWFRDYVYLPIRKKFLPNSGMWLSILIVLSLSGIWHGANWQFLAWGITNALFLIAFTYIKRKKIYIKLFGGMNDWLANKFMLLSISITCVFFRSSDFEKALTMLSDMFKNIPSQIVSIIKNTHNERNQLLYIKQSSFAFFFSIFCLTALFTFERKFYEKRIDDWLITKSKAYRWTFYYALVAVFVFFGVFIRSEFIYFQF